MSLSLSTLLQKQKNLKGYKPLVGIDISGVGEAFSVFREFASDTQRFADEMDSKPSIVQSVDQIGRVAKRGGMNFSINNQDLFSDLFSEGGSYPDPENEVVDGYLYFDVADVTKYSVLFDSSLSQYINIPYTAALKPALPISVEVWFMLNDSSIGNQIIFFASDDHTDFSGIWIGKTTTEKLFITYGDNAGTAAANRRTLKGDTTLVANQWYHLLITGVGTGATFISSSKIYINATEDTPYTNSGSTLNAMGYEAGKTSTISCRNSSDYADAYIAQVGFWDVELSSADATSLYGDGSPKDLTDASSYNVDRTGDLQGYWKLNEGIGTATDEPQNNADGTLTNSPLWSQLIPCCLDSDRLQFFKGVISEFPTISYNKLGFQADNRDLLFDKKIGDLLTDDDAADTGQGLPDWGKGKIKPIIFGDHTFLKADDAKSTDTADIENNMVPIVYLGIDSSDRHRWWVSSNKSNEIINTADLCQIWGFDNTVGRYVRLQNFTVEQNTSAGCIISHANQPTFWDYWYSSGAITVSNAGGNTTDFANSSRAGDKLFDNPSTGSININSGNSSWIQMDVPFPDYDNNIGTLTGAVIFIYAKLTYGGGAVDADFTFKIGVDAVPVGDLSPATHPTSAAYPETRLESDDFATATETVRIRLAKVSANVNETCQCDIYEVYKKISYAPETLLPLFFAGKGREYDTWINDREAGVDSDPEGNLYTETHADHDGVGNLIENPAGVIESILVDDLGIGNTDIYENLFNIVSNDLNTNKFSFGITKQTDAYKFIGEMMKRIKTIFFSNARNLISARTLITGNNFSASGDSVPNNEDIFEFDPQTTFKIVSGENDKIDFDDGGGAIVATITQGTYTGDGLSTEIDDAMTNASTVDGSAKTYVVTYSSTTGKFTIVQNSGTFSLLLFSGGNSATSVGRFIGYDISADDTGALTYTSDYPLWADSFVEHPIAKNTFSIKKASEKLITIFNVNYNLNIYNNNYQQISSVTDNTFHSESIEVDFNHPFTQDQTTAEFYRDHLKDRQNRKHYEVEFYTFLNGISVELYDIINVRHPVLTGLISNENTKKWIVTGIKPSLNKMQIGITAVEV